MATIRDRSGNTLRVGVAATVQLEVLACIAADVALPLADFRGVNFDGLDLSGLQAPEADFTGGSMLNITANKLVRGKPLELSAALLQGVPITGTLTVANLACTRPTMLRADMGPSTRIRGCDFSGCPDVLVLPVKDDQVGVVISFRNGAGWKIHAGDRGVLTEAQAKTQLAQNADATIAAKYAPAVAYLESAEGVQAKATIDARPIGTGAVVKPTGTVAEQGGKAVSQGGAK